MPPSIPLLEESSFTRVSSVGEAKSSRFLLSIELEAQDDEDDIDANEAPVMSELVDVIVLSEWFLRREIGALRIWPR